LGLLPHPEGGHYAETYRAAFRVTPSGDSGETSAVTSIHYLLQDDDFSGFHRIAYPELWYFHDGTALDIHEIDAEGNHRARRLGRGPGESLFLVVEPGTWFAAELPEKTGFSLVSCAVAPAFDFAKFEMAKKADLLRAWPRLADVVNRLARD